MTALHVQFSVPFEYRVFFTRAAFDVANPLLGDVIGANDGVRRAVVFFEEALLAAHPRLGDSITGYFSSREIELAADPVMIGGGEAVKNDLEPLKTAVERIVESKLCRHSYVIAIGGGAMLDVVGFAAAIAHRGIRLIRFPTTTLAQADAGVGVKNAVNFAGKKNLLGTFAPPVAVINDFDLLDGLSDGQKRDGFVEAVKVALIRDAEFFSKLERMASDLARCQPDAMEYLIRRCAELHVNHIAKSGDPFEMGTARPLDFGHWAAHKLEQLSGFRISHGAAVAAGIALDVVYSHRVGMLDRDSMERVLRLLETLGFEVFPREFRDLPEDLLTGLEEFREHLGGELTVTLLAAIGRGVEVHEMNRSTILASLEDLAKR